MWGKECSAYNIQILLNDGTRNALSGIQNLIKGSMDEPLLRVPAPTMHVSVAPLLGVRQDYDRPKELIWEDFGDVCVENLRTIAAGCEEFEIKYTGVVATDTAIIAVANDEGQLGRLREKIFERLPLPENRSIANVDMIHTTLFRYPTQLKDVGRLLDTVAAVAPEVALMTVSNLVLSKECVYPSLESRVLATVRLA